MKRPVLDLRILVTVLPAASTVTSSASVGRARREHPDDLDVAAEGHGLDAVLGLPALGAPDRRAEADEVLGDLPAEPLRGDHVAELVQPDRGEDGEHEQQGARDPQHRVHCPPVPYCASAATALPPDVGPTRPRRGRPRRRVMVPRGYVVLGEHGLDRRDDPVERQPLPPGTPPHPPRWRRCRPRVPCRPGGRPPGPGSPRGTPRRRGGRSPTSVVWSSRRPAPCRGSGRARSDPSAIGISMVGGLACAIVEPSTNSTIECTTLVGCTTTSIRSNGMPNSRCASITSRPLLTRVAELMVMTGPMSQVGCASASSGVTLGQVRPAAAAERPAARGQHEASYVSVPAGRACRDPQALGEGAVLGVDRHDLARLRPVEHERAAHDQRLLVGQGERRPGLQRRQRGAQPHRAGDAVEHHVARAARPPRSTPPRPGLRTRERTRPPGRRTGPGCSRRRSGRRPGTGPGCCARGRAPGCRSSRSTRG